MRERSPEDQSQECDVNDAAELKKKGKERAFATENIWPLGIVPFAQDLVDPVPERLLERSIEHWASQTDLQFVPRTDERAYLIFADRGRCSSSSVGYTGFPITLRVAGCGVSGAIHEIGHAVGLWHEHTRPDRDDHIIVHWDRIEPGARGQFTKRNGKTFGPIDFESIMMYTRGAFSATGEETMTPIDPTVRWLRNTVLSQGDIDGVAMLYAEEIAKREGSEPPDPEPPDPEPPDPEPPDPEPPKPKPRPRVLELQDGRFEARVTWVVGEQTGRGLAVPGTPVSGAFTFWDPRGWELLVTVRDGREINSHWWVTASCASDQAWRATITDTETGRIWEARNLAGQRSPAFVDIEAFPEQTSASERPGG